MESTWVDFKTIKAAVSLQMVLDHYGINWLQKKGDELRGRCPIHQGEGQQSFHASLTKNAFHCFSCKARGNVLDFVAAMEKCSVRDAAVNLQEWFSVTAKAPTEKPERAKGEKRGEAVPKVDGNKPLSFELKGIDHSHPYLAERGITKETAETFGVGLFSGRGSMSGRIVIPIYNERGELLAYAGRAIDGSEPRYKLPVGFHKSAELFNLHRAIGECGRDRRVVVVEGFFDCMKVSAAGFPCVALMGSSLSETQEQLLATHFKSVCLFMDGDEAGQLATADCLGRLGRKVWVRAVGLASDQQPDRLSGDEIKSMLEI